MIAEASHTIAAIAASRVLLAVAHPRIAAGLEALLDAEHRYQVERASSGADLEGRSADAVIADAVFIKMNGAPAGIPAIVLLDASTDRASLAERVPLARAWLTTASTGDELIAELDRVLATPARLDTVAAAPTAPLPVIERQVASAPAAGDAASGDRAREGSGGAPPAPSVGSASPSQWAGGEANPRARDARAAAGPAAAVAVGNDAGAASVVRESVGETLGALALLVLGVTCSAIALAFLWLAVRP